MILVLGATGTTGGEVARQLIAAGERPRLLVRSTAKARSFEGKADLVAGDIGDVASLRTAMRGVDRLYMVATGTDLLKLESGVVEAAVAEGVKHVVKLSVIGADAPQFSFARWHRASEEKLMKSGLGWTMVRPTNFMSNALGWAPSIKAQGAVYQPTGTGGWAAIDPVDIGAVAVEALLKKGHEGKAYSITGPQSMDGAGYTAVLARVLGKPLQFVDVPPDAAKQGMLTAGMPPAYVDALIELLAAIKAGKLDVATGTAQELLGRKPTTFESWAQRNEQLFS